jgi:hypothetical protein
MATPARSLSVTVMKTRPRHLSKVRLYGVINVEKGESYSTRLCCSLRAYLVHWPACMIALKNILWIS